MDNWARKLIEDHRNPLTKLELSGPKLFIPSGSKEEKEIVEKNVAELAKAIEQERVEKRCTRAEAVWKPDKRLGLVTRNVGHLKNFGFGEKNDKYLYPEEMLFLIEMNRLQLQWENCPLSLEKSYKILIDSNMDHKKYVAYKKLVQQGYRLIRKELFEKRSKNNTEIGQKRKSENVEPESSKKIKSDQGQPSCSRNNDGVITRTDFLQKLQELREKGPKNFQPEVTIDYDYKVFAPDNNSRLNPDYNLYFWEGDNVGPEIGCLDKQIDNLICFTSCESPTFFEVGTVDLPVLE